MASREAPRAGMSLERRLPLLFSVLLAVVVAVFAVAAYRETRGTAMLAAEERLQRATSQLAALSANGGALRTAFLRGIANEAGVRAALRPGAAPDSAEAVFRRANAADSLAESFVLLDSLSVVRAQAGVPDDDASRLALGDLQRALVRGDSLRASRLFVHGRRVSTWSVYPIREDGRLVATLAQRRRLPENPAVEGQVRGLVGQDVSLFFTNLDGSLWSGPRGAPLSAPFAAPLRPGIFHARATSGEALLGALAPVPASGIGIVVTMPESVVLARPREFLRRMLYVGAFLVLLGAIATWLASRRVTRPLRLVTDAAGALAGGDFDRRVDIARRDEIGRLGSAFNAMALRVGEAVDRTAQLQSVTAALSGALEVRAVAQVIVERGVAAVDAHAGSIYLLGSDGRSLELLRADGYPAELLKRMEVMPLDAPLPLADAVRNETAVWVGSTRAWEERYPKVAGALSQSRAWAALPLVARGRALGVMGLSFHEEEPFDAETRAYLLALAEQCAQAMDRALLYEASDRARRDAEEARESAQAANAAKSAFLAMMSHELRTPLNAIGGYVELLEMGLRGPVTESQREDLLRIRRNQHHLLGVINDILSLSRIEAGQLPVHVGDVALADVLGDVESLIAPQMSAKGLRFEVGECDPTIMVRADREKAQQVLLNLLSNAVRFTDHGAVSVHCVEHPTEIEIRVADTGIGIPAELHEQIFEPFMQADGGLTRRRGGTGLGLAISRELALAMGGRVTVSSTPGRGSTFALVLPRMPSRPRPSETRSHHAGTR